MIRTYDRKGIPISIDEWHSRLESERRVAETTLPDGKWVSTVWLGLDHRHGDGPPLIFETMVFPSNGEWGDLDCERYSTEGQAVAGQAAMVEKWSRGGEAAP